MLDEAKSQPAQPKRCSPDILTPTERQDRIVELLARGMKRIYEQEKERKNPQIHQN